jgi:hypothetical protein
MLPTLPASQSVRIHTPGLPQFVHTPVRDAIAGVRPFPLFLVQNYPVHRPPPGWFPKLTRTLSNDSGNFHEPEVATTTLFK